ncbi:sugar ABC transporter ATP-binding protein [Mesorhizobium helmanticense]|uniref:Sugar ABC transporter ATP-binding protein n=1 Tax=Mesorhizobium helmanticense TaxID=1776423 RepID=A0A2T4IZL6_9HYPH|nr:sugar ABC transporter ATP-binding protein [Mesorhizobium helmanticense]
MGGSGGPGQAQRRLWRRGEVEGRVRRRHQALRGPLQERPVQVTSLTVVGRPDLPGGRPAAAPALELRDISKTYPGTNALTGVSFVLRRHQMLGLVGENGAGKSTLLSIINGTVRPDTGTISINGEAVRFGHPTEAARNGVATVFQEQGLIPTIPVFENIFLGRETKFTVAGGLRRKAMIAEARAVLEELEVDVSPTALTGALSFGQRQLVEIAKAFALSRVYPVEPIILLDEPTSALSDHETAKLFDGINRWRSRASFVLVSHRLSDVFAICDEVVALKDGHVVDQRPIKSIDEVALHELIVGRQRNAEYYREAVQREPSATVALRATGISKPGHLRGVSLDLREGEILGVAGVLGSGKSTLARIIAGAEAQGEGDVIVEGATLLRGSRRDAIRHGIGFVPAERSVAGIIGTDTVDWNLTLPNLKQIALGFLGLISPRRSRALTVEWMQRLKVRAPGPSAACRTLSGGNQQKIVFAKWLARGVRILVLDDPGRGLDVGAKEDIYSLMREIADKGAAVLLVSDNLPELIGLSNRIMVLRDGVVSAIVETPKDAKPREVDVVSAML